jgi:Cu+-exporting ATPase
METEVVKWKVEGMDCTTCALNISKYLEREGLKNVKVNFATGDVLFEEVSDETKEKIAKGIDGLGYKVVNGHGAC